MIAPELANELEKCWADPGLQLKAAALLRRQHEAIVKLREALESVEQRSRWSDSYINDVAEKALKDTEGL